MKDIHIVIVNYLMKNDVVEILHNVFDDIKDSAIDVAVTVVDNSQNQDGIKQQLLQFEAVNYIDAHANIGFGKANNLGFRSQEARYYFSLNPDTKIDKDQQVIKRMVDFMDANKKIGAIGPKVLHFDGTLQYTCYRFNLSSIMVKPFRQLKLDKKFKTIKKYVDQLEMRDFDHNATQPVDWVLGAAMIVRKEVTDKIGWFDERYFMYLEDCDWCRRMWEANFSVYYVHDIVIKHRHGRGSAKVPGVFTALIKNKLARIHLASWLKFLWKWRSNNKYYEKVS